MSERPTGEEKVALLERCVELYGKRGLHRRHGRAVQISALRFVIDCLSCGGSGQRPARPGVKFRGELTCARCQGEATEIVTAVAARNIHGHDAIDYLSDWNFSRSMDALREAGAKSIHRALHGEAADR